MSLQLGKSFNRNYNIRLPFLDGFYEIGLFYNTKTSFLLFSVNSDFSQSKESIKHNSKVNMFKNIESSKFCEVFLNLQNYRNQNLDIVNQFREIKPEYTTDISLLNNETIINSKIIVDDYEIYDKLNLYYFTISSYSNEFLFLIAERQNVIPKLKKKIVRSSGIQIATTSAILSIDDYFNELLESKIKNVTKKIPSSESIIIK